jgi:pilus assembly protein CpaB
MTLLVAVGLGVLAMILMYAYISGRETQLLQLAEPRNVVVASKDIGANRVIDESMILQRTVPAIYVQPKAVTDPRAAIGRVTAVPMAQGAQILATGLEEAGRTLVAYEIPRGQRAVTIGVNDVTGVAGLVRPGNLVDIFGTFQFGRPAGAAGGQVQYADHKTEVRMLAQNVKVVAVGRDYRGDRPDVRRVTGQETAEQEAAEADEVRARRERQVQSVTLIAEPRQAQELVLAQEIGTLTLVLRSTLDTGTVVDLGMLDALGLLKVPLPVIPKAGPWFREFRGGS